MYQQFGFGCMRFPQIGEEIDIPQVKKMFDLFLENGFCYFDTAHGYHSGKSEHVVQECLTSRYPRERYILTTKLSGGFFKKEADILPLFEEQLQACGVEYFDYYLMHAQNAENFEEYKRCRAYETAMLLKQQGKIRHLGISFHDTADVLDRILTEYPQVEIVQLQVNYLDYDDPEVQGRECLAVCRKHGKPVIVMEPVKGGHLVNLPEKAQAVLDSLHGGSAASYALRFAAGCEGVVMTLSGMGSLDQVRDNISCMKNYRPLNAAEMDAVAKVCGIVKGLDTIPCTACRYCTDGCPKKIAIPDLFSCMNRKKVFAGQDPAKDYQAITAQNGKASDCIACGKCEAVCPQHLPVRSLLRDTAHEFENRKEA